MSNLIYWKLYLFIFMNCFQNLTMSILREIENKRRKNLKNYNNKNT